MTEKEAQLVVGSIWRERRRAYRKRTVEVEQEAHGFVYVRTITCDNGQPPKRVTRTRIRRSLWHGAFEEVSADA